MDPKGYIEEIQKKYENSKDIVLDSLAGAIDRLQKAFPSRGHFLMEFIQNADDENSKAIKIEIDEDIIKFFNDGECFSQEDVESICKVGRSSKKAEYNIGYLGVGFKSVFLISDCPQIYSGDYRFKFDKNHWKNPKNTPWQVMPAWIDNHLDIQNEDWKTIFVIPKAKEMGEKIIWKLDKELSDFNNRVILFLRNINEIEIYDKIKNIKKKIVKSENISDSESNYEIYTVEEYENEELKIRDKWLIFRSECNVPNEVREDQATIDWERQEVTKREVLATLRLEEEDNLKEEEKGTAHTGVFSFVPLKEIESGLKFSFQADFLTTPGRADIQRESLWNKWMAEEIFNLIITKCVPEFLKDERWKFNFTKVLYPGEGGHELFEKNIQKPLRDYLKANSVLIAEDGSTAKAVELVSVTPEIRKLLTKDDLQILYSGKRVIHPYCKADSHLDAHIKKLRAPYGWANAHSNLYHFVRSTETEELMNQKAKSGDVEWFKKIYSTFAKYNRSYFWKYTQYNKEHDVFWNKMHNLSTPIILTDKNELAKVTECYIKPRNLDIPKEIGNNFKIVHPAIAEDENFKSFRKKLNEERYIYPPPEKESIKELTEKDIEEALKTVEALRMTEEEWNNLSDNEKIDKIKSIKDLLKSHKIAPLSFLTLKTKSGKWLKPVEIVFSKEYNPDHRLETLKEKGFLDFSLEFLSTDFIEKQDDEEIVGWRNFFRKLGVDDIINNTEEKKNISNRIGILTARYFEREIKRRDPEELTESEEGHPGYDIKSISRSGEIHIEVKGRSGSGPDLFLSVNESKTLMKEGSKYFVYMVIDTLDNPTLCVLKGDDLLENEEYRMVMNASKWKKLIKEEFQPLLDTESTS